MKIDTLKSFKETYRFLDISLFLFALTLPMWNNLNTVFIYPIFAAWLLQNNWTEKFTLLKKNLVPFILLVFVFFLYLSNFIFSDDTSQNIKLAIKTLPIIIFPLVFFTTPTHYYKLGSVFTGLTFGTFLTIFICWGRIFLDILSKKDPLDQATYFFEWIYTDFNLLKPFGAHPSYVGVMVVLVIIILMCYKGFQKFREEKVLYRLSLLTLIFFILQTNSRISFICLIIFLCYYFLRNFNKISLVQLLILFTGLFLLSLKFDYLFHKISSILSSDGQITFDRFPRWVAIWEENKIWGNFWVGVGKEKSQFIFNESYLKNGFDLALKENYNAHNQYLDFFISNGILGVIVYILPLIYFLSKTHKNIISISFILIIIFFSISETIFGRSVGLIFFSFFYALLYSNFNTQSLK